jgi:TonB-dependent SusC/RagA subfamily outer membrane receptor
MMRGFQVCGYWNVYKYQPSSISGNDPLFIVDGVPVDKIEYFTGQVKSIEVLKGVDAAIYGTRSANGVLIIKLISAEDRNKK